MTNITVGVMKIVGQGRKIGSALEIVADFISRPSDFALRLVRYFQ
jgi:hypothetical protein